MISIAKRVHGSPAFAGDDEFENEDLLATAG